METMEVSMRDKSLKANNLRKHGMVPGNIYGGNLKESILIQMNADTASRIILRSRIGSRLNLVLEGKKIPVQIKDRDIRSQDGQLQNVSFQALADDQKANSVATLVLKNYEKVAGMREFMITEIPYAALPCDMIDVLELDIRNLKIGSVLTVGDIPELNNDKIDLQIDKEEIVLRISDPKHNAPADIEQDSESVE